MENERSLSAPRALGVCDLSGLQLSGLAMGEPQRGASLGLLRQLWEPRLAGWAPDTYQVGNVRAVQNPPSGWA